MTFALWLLMNASIVADWGQTRNISTAMRDVRPYASSCTGCGALDYQERQFSETGPASLVLGKHPSRGQVDAFFIGSLVVNNGIMVALPKKYKPYYAGAVTAMETYFVVSNNRIGIKIDF